MVNVKVDPGVCGLPTKINVTKIGPMKVRIELESSCEHIDNMSKELNEVEAYYECFKSGDKSQILEVASRHCQHFSCPVPMAIIKAIEVALGVASPKDVQIVFLDDKKQD